MQRLAVFVEGQTELRFVAKLLEELAGKNNVTIETRRIVGGSTVPRKTIILEGKSRVSETKFYALIFDCGGDHQVKSRIVEEHEGLTKAGYSIIIGMRDVRPDFQRAEIPQLEQGLRTRLKTSLAPVEFILCAMEVEAWFLSEATHFERIDPVIKIEAIRLSLGFDPSADDLSLRPTPAIDLDACYQLANIRYEKGSVRTTNALDYLEIFAVLPARIPYLQKFIELLDNFLTLPAPTFAG